MQAQHKSMNKDHVRGVRIVRLNKNHVHGAGIIRMNKNQTKMVASIKKDIMNLWGLLGPNYML